MGNLMSGQVYVFDKWNPNGHKQLYDSGIYDLDSHNKVVIVGPKTKISFYSKQRKIKTIVNRTDHSSVAETDNLSYDQIKISILKNNISLFFIIFLIIICFIYYLVIKFI